jgi:hypothetical protein
MAWGEHFRIHQSDRTLDELAGLSIATVHRIQDVNT